MPPPAPSAVAARTQPGAAAAPPGDTWVGLSGHDLPLAEASAWAVVPHCGAVVSFTGTARDHGAGRDDVFQLEYEAYEPYAGQRLAAVAGEVRRRWPDVGRVALLHRTGVVAVEQAAVIVVVSAPHREEAFEAARFAIDEAKATVPLWKRESWPGGSAWTEPCHHQPPGAP